MKNIFKKYSPYCSECGSCGETGCCSPIGCTNHVDGKYCISNQDEMRVSYLTLNEFWNLLSVRGNSSNEDKKVYDEMLEKLESIYEKHSDFYYEKRMAEPEKIFWYERILNWFRS
jgi:alpha-galactosidase/6-phospho-beta-glucosidase family protein